jgi:hypothetical protein
MIHQFKGAFMTQVTQTQTVMDTAVLDEVIHWIKALKEAGVSPDTAANVTSRFFIAASSMSEDDEEEYGDEEYPDYDEE